MIGIGKTAQGGTVPLTIQDRRTHIYCVGKTVFSDISIRFN
jgi:hypothetical protein